MHFGSISDSPDHKENYKQELCNAGTLLQRQGCWKLYIFGVGHEGREMLGKKEVTITQIVYVTL